MIPMTIMLQGMFSGEKLFTGETIKLIIVRRSRHFIMSNHCDELAVHFASLIVSSQCVCVSQWHLDGIQLLDSLFWHEILFVLAIKGEGDESGHGQSSVFMMVAIVL